jgi:hypothetical protein
MIQNEIDKTYTEQQLKDFNDALIKLEGLTADLPILSGDEKSQHVRPPEGAGDWMRDIATRAQQNINKLSREYDPALLQRDLAYIDTTEPLILRLQRIIDRLKSGTFLANSDAFSVSLDARRQLKNAGVHGNDDNLNEGLKRFFSRPGASKPATVGNGQK